MADVKTLVNNAQTTRFDGAGGISPSEFSKIKEAYHSSSNPSEAGKWLEQKNPNLARALRDGLDYSGYSGTSIGALNGNTEISPQASKGWIKDNRPSTFSGYTAEGRRTQGMSGPVLAKDENGVEHKFDSGDPIGTYNGDKVRVYNTNGNISKIGESVLNPGDEAVKKGRAGQDEMTAKMSGVIGVPVTNPPSTTAAKAYFQTMSQRGASQEDIKKEYGKFTETFYKHAGGGVEWKPELKAAEVDQRFAQQPIAKDGKRIIDCEGYSALTENVLGGLKGKDGKPMFDIMHATNADHITTGVFPRGGDPKKGFVVDNGAPKDIPFNPASQGDFNKTGKGEAQLRFLMRNYMGQEHSGSTVREYGTTISNMAPPGQRL